MALYLNTNAAYKDFQMHGRDKYFVDKSAIIERINERVKTKNRFLCITKPRRFGKTWVLNMLGAYYERRIRRANCLKGWILAEAMST